MKLYRFISMLLCLIFLISGCGSTESAPLAATTLPVCQFTEYLCQGTGLEVTQLVTENVSCLHDYTLQVSQMRRIEEAETVIISGAGLEEFLDDALSNSQNLIDASKDISLITCDGHHEEDHGHSHEHSHDEDPHIWLSPANAAIMAQTICSELSFLYPQHTAVFQKNLSALLSQLEKLQSYGEEKLADLSCRELITFHDGFAYFAAAFDLTILEAVEEESGSEASAKELIHLIEIVNEHQLPAIFTETNGSTSAAQIIASETGATVYTLDMAMAGDDYFSAMYRNIDTIQEALG